MGHAGDVGVGGDAHHARAFGPFPVQGVELVPGSLEYLGGLVILGQVDRDVVKLQGVGHRHQPSVFHLHLVGLVVVAPIADVLDALFDQDVRRLEGLGQAGTHPTPGRRAGEFLDCADGLADGFPLIGFGVDDSLDEAVGHHLPSRFEALLHQMGIGVAHRRVQANGRPNAVAVQHLFHPPEAHPHAIVVPGIVGDIGNNAAALGDGQHGAGHGLVDVPLFHVDNRPHHDPGAAGQFQGFTFEDV